MADYDNTNRGTLFTNDRKTTSNHPDYTGKINCNGAEFWLSGWLNESRQGKKYISIKIGTLVEEKPSATPVGFPNTEEVDESKGALAPPKSDIDSDIPF